MTRAVATFVLLLLFTVLVRLPFFFPAVLDWDESTFILIGQSILDGHLPYVTLWDVKPPLLFAFFSLAIATFGESVPAVRFAGALCVAVAAFLVYSITVRSWRRSAATLAAALTVLIASLLPSGQATMSEHVVLPLLIGVACVWMAGETTGRAYWMGVLVAVAALVRINLALVAVAIGFLIALQYARDSRATVRHLLAYAAGGLTVVALTCLPFLVAGQLTTLWTATVVAALVRSTSENSALSNMVQLGMSAFGAGPRGYLLSRDSLWLSSFLWLSASAGVALVWYYRKSLGSAERRAVTMVAVLGIAIGASIAFSGGANPHYFIQLVPFAAVFSAAMMNYLPRILRGAAWAGVVALAIMSARPVVDEYRSLTSRIRANQRLDYGTAYEVAEYLRRENPSGRPIFLMTDQLVYWLTKSSPPTGLVAHPSTLARQDVLNAIGTTTERETLNVFHQGPEFVVIETGDWVLEGESRRLLESILTRDYVAVDAGIQGRDVYKRTR